MTNEEKAIELAENISPYDIGGDNAAHYAAKDAALDAMEWKDEQHEKEKQQLIDKACKEFCNCCAYAYMACRRYNYDNLHCRHYIKFKKAMKGE